jgi:hypothetical protein
MRRLGALCLFLGLTAPALAAEPPAAEDPPSVPWYRRWFLGEQPKPTPPRQPQPPAAAGRDRATAGPTPRESAKEAAAKQFDLEQRVYLQRLQAISRIRQVAAEQNDEATLKRADDLEQQAEEIFKQRTAKLMGVAEREDRAALERGRDDRPATADRTPPRRRTTGGNDR